MPLLFLIVGVLFIVTAIKGNQADVATQVEKDFTGAGNFFIWIGAIIAISVVGQVADLKTAAKALIFLIVAVYIVAQNGLFTNFSSALTSLTAPAATPANQVGSSQDVAGTSTPAPSASGASTAPSSTSNAPVSTPSLTINPGQILG